MILAIDTSSKAASCALMERDNLLGEVFQNTGMTHSQTILEMVDQLLANCRCSISQIRCYCVSAGPGSFTGLRIGLSLVKGLAFDSTLPCVSISTLEGLAYNLMATRQKIIAVMDARRNQFYTAIFEFQNNQLLRCTPDQAIPIDALEHLLQEIPDAQQGILVGDGAFLCRQLLGDKFPLLTTAPPHLLLQRASSFCVAATQALTSGHYTTAAQLEPVYLRVPQAERERSERLARQCCPPTGTLPPQ